MAPPPEVEPEPDEAPDRPPFPDGDPASGWVRALALGALSFAAMLGLAVIIAVAAFLDGMSLFDAVRAGGLLFFGFHHAGVKTAFPTFDPAAAPEGGPGGPDLGLGPIDISFTIAVALLTATFLAMFLLYRSGRRAADEGGGSVGLRIAQGAAAGVAYAVLAVLLSFVARVEAELPAELAQLLGASGTITLSVDPLSALLWPLGLGVLAGGLGGWASARPAIRPDVAPRASGALQGAAAGLLAVLVLGFAGLLVLAGLSPDVTADYFSAVTEGRSGLVLLVFTILVVPNMAVLGTVIGMGGSVVVGQYLGETAHVASLLRFPEQLPGGAAGVVPAVPGATPGEFGMAPPGYFFFIVVALVATILAGRRAARAAGSATAGEGAVAGVLAGILWGLAMVVLGVLSGIGMSASTGIGGLAETQGGFAGPDFLMGAGLALAWGVFGGALGGATGAGAPAAPRQPPRRDLEEYPREPRSERSTRVAPTGGATGFEGLAAQRYWAEEDLAEPAVEEEPSEAERRDEHAPSSAEQDAPAEEPDAAGVAPGDEEASTFEFATPSTQYGAPPPGPEEAGPESSDDTTPPPIPPPWDLPGEEAGRPARPTVPGPEPSGETQRDEPERWGPVEERGPDVEEPQPWAPLPEEPEAEEPTVDEPPPPWAPVPEEPGAEEPPATPWGGPLDSDDPGTGEPAPWRPPGDEDPAQAGPGEEPPAWAPTEGEGTGEEPATPWGVPPEQDHAAQEPQPWTPPGTGEAGDQGAELPPWVPPAPAADEVEGNDQEERPPWEPPPWSPPADSTEDDRDDEDRSDPEER